MQDFITNKTIERLKYDLVKEGLISYEQLSEAENISEAQKINVGQALIKANILDEKTLLKYLEEKLHIPYVNLDDYTPDKKCLKFIESQDAKKYKILPLFKIEDSLTIAMADPMDLFTIYKLIDDTEFSIEPVISSENSIIKHINKLYFDQDAIEKEELDSKIDWRELLNTDNQDTDFIQKVIKTIVNQAISENVHEVFMENKDEGLAVTFKRNEEFETKGHIPSLLIPIFISQLKTLAKLDPSVSELPQLGKMGLLFDKTTYTISASAFPTIMGERISLKIYSPPKKLEELAIAPTDLDYIKRSFEKPGITLVCGSGLSGKTLVIYSILSSLAKSKKNIMSLESIVKYDIKDLNQCELNESVGFNLDKAMRFIEFQSPDVIYFEGVNTKEGLDFFASLVYKQKSLITEFLSVNISDLRKKFAHPAFDNLKQMLNCIIYIHSKDSIEVFTKEDLSKYI